MPDAVLRCQWQSDNKTFFFFEYSVLQPPGRALLVTVVVSGLFHTNFTRLALDNPWKTKLN